MRLFVVNGNYDTIFTLNNTSHASRKISAPGLVFDFYASKIAMEKVVVTVEVTDNNYAAFIENLPGCVSTGKTFRELKSNMLEAVAGHLEVSREFGDEIPEPFNGEYELSFRFDTQS